MIHVTNKHPRGFTLIELLIVVTIIAILASISFAVYGKVTQTARSAESLSNLKQLGSTWTIATSEGASNLRSHGKNYFQPSSGVTPGTVPDGAQKFTWMDLVGEYMSYCEPGNGQYDWHVNIADTILRNPTVNTVPTYDGTDIEDAKATSGYGLNRHLSGYANQYSPDPNKTRVTQVKSPASKILFTETNPDDGGSLRHLSGIFNPPKGVMSDANRGGANCVFIDGHAGHLTYAEVWASDASKKSYYFPDWDFDLNP